MPRTWVPYAALAAGLAALRALSPAHTAELPENASATFTLPCGSAAGTRFNLEPRQNPLPQNGTAIDYLPEAGIGGADLVVGAANDMRLLTSGSGTAPDYRGVPGLTSQTGFYVHRNIADPNACSADFEGGLASIPSPATGNPLVGVGYPAVAAHAPSQSFFIADTRVGNGEEGESAIGVHRTTKANLNNPSVCPDGTLSEAASRQCWPSRTVVDLGSFLTQTNANPDLAVDERTQGTGAGDVYVTGTQFGQNRRGGFHSSVFVVACKNDLSACSQPVTISGMAFADFSSVAVRPDGVITATYTVQTNGVNAPTAVQIRFVSCRQRGAPAQPLCRSSSLIATETQAIPYIPSNSQAGLAAAKFVLHTFPQHAHRQDANGVETYVVWDRCKVSTAVTYPGLTFLSKCVDSDIQMAASSNGGSTWQFAPLDTGAQDQFQPQIAVDRSSNSLHVAYYSSEADGSFQHRPQVYLRQIPPGGSTPDTPGPAQLLTTLPMEPNGDPVLKGIFIGHYIGVAARSGPSGSRVYVHYTHSADAGQYNGVSDPEHNNHLSRLDN